jgi:abhydrolase domain-containing protein 6
MKIEQQSSPPASQHRFSQRLANLHRGIYNAGLAMERFRSRLSLRHVELGGRSCCYLERPGPGAKVILVHGFTGSKDNWLKYVQHLPRHLHIIAPDLIGHGENEPDLEFEYDGWSLTEALRSFLQGIGCDRFHLVGHSLGGLLSAGYAFRYPDNVQSLFLISPAGAQTTELSECYQMIEEGCNPFLCDTRAEYDRIMDILFHGPDRIPSLAHTFLCRDLVERKPVFAKVWDDLNAGDENVATLLKDIETPTRVVWGRYDRVLHPSGMEVYRENIPNADSAWLECGHCPPVECPKELATLHLEMMTQTATA